MSAQLMAEVRQSCTPHIWSQGVELARRGAVRAAAHQGAAGVVELQVATPRGGPAAQVALNEPDCDWTCDCQATEAACSHVAAGVIALHQARQRGHALPKQLREHPVQIIYILEEQANALVLRRRLKVGRQTVPLQMPLGAWRAAQARAPEIFISPADARIDTLLGVRPDEVPPRPRLAELLSQLMSCERVLLAGQKVRIEAPQAGVVCRLYERAGAIEVRLAQETGITRIYSNGAMRRGHTLCPIAPLPFDGAQLEGWRRGRVFPAEDLAHVLGDIVPELQKVMPVNLGPWANRKKHQAPPYVLITCKVETTTLALSWLPSLVYGQPPLARVELPADRSDPGWLRGLGGTPVQRQPPAEALAVAALETQTTWRIGERGRALGDAAVAMALRLVAWGGQLAGDDLAQLIPAGTLVPVAGGSGPLGLDFRALEGPTRSLPGVVRASQAAPPSAKAGRQAALEAVLGAWASGDHFVRLMDGGVAPLPQEWLEQHGHLVRDIMLQTSDPDKPTARLDQARLARALDTPPPPSLRPWVQLLLDNTQGLPEVPLPADLRASLRPYQQAGVNWLSCLRTCALGGLLADDMGLGKTLQVMCAMSGRTLVVAPTSVLVSWQQQLTQFRPSLKMAVYHGPGRSLDPAADVTLTSYAILRLDSRILGAVEWDTLICDEAQAIKNPDSQVAQAAYQQRAVCRIAMTGTPIENRLDELWSQMHFLNPGYLGEREAFDRQWARPIAAGEVGAAASLRQKLAPLILRRRKTEVAADLPARTEVVLRCQLTEDERALYDAILASTQKEVVARLESGGSTMAALEALLRLRQACCHRALVPGQRAKRSSKIDLLLETLEAAVAAGHKAIIFSQWTSLLDKVEPLMDAIQLRFCRLDGSTRDRQGVIESFNNDPGIKAMLISLKAGGTGLTLTAADHVFLLDPWWNPAVEDQAADRAHRLGQTRAVIIHRLIAQDTVEERILRLQEGKRALVRAALEGDEGSGGTGIASLSRDDLLMLLREDSVAAETAAG